MVEMASRGIIESFKDNEKYIVSIKRTKYRNGKEEKIYYTIPGGHVENNETFEETLIREIKEELNINVKIEEEFLHLYNEDLNKDEKFYICSIVSGNISKGNGPEWLNENVEKYGKYEIEFINVKEINKYNLLPFKIKEMLIYRYKIN